MSLLVVVLFINFVMYESLCCYKRFIELSSFVGLSAKSFYCIWSLNSVNNSKVLIRDGPLPEKENHVISINEKV